MFECGYVCMGICVLCVCMCVCIYVCICVSFIIQKEKLGCVCIYGVCIIVSFIMLVGVEGLECVMGESVSVNCSWARYWLGSVCTGWYWPSIIGLAAEIPFCSLSVVGDSGFFAGGGVGLNAGACGERTSCFWLCLGVVVGWGCAKASVGMNSGASDESNSYVLVLRLKTSFCTSCCGLNSTSSLVLNSADDSWLRSLS